MGRLFCLGCVGFDVGQILEQLTRVKIRKWMVEAPFCHDRFVLGAIHMVRPVLASDLRGRGQQDAGYSPRYDGFQSSEDVIRQSSPCSALRGHSGSPRGDPCPLRLRPKNRLDCSMPTIRPATTWCCLTQCPVAWATSALLPISHRHPGKVAIAWLWLDPQFGLVAG